MSNGNNFGRRPGTSAAPTTTRKRPAPPTDAPAEAALLASEQDDARASRRAMMHIARMSGLAVTGLVGLWLISGSLGSMVDLRQIGPTRSPSAVKTANVTPAAEPDGTSAQDDRQAQDSATEPDAAPAPDKTPSAGVKRVTADERRTAALQFFAFYHLNTRIRSAFCASRGVDITAFASQFRQSQRTNHARATEVAAAAGLTEERIFADSRAELNGLIDADMEQLGQNTGMGAAGGCRLMVQHAAKFVPGIDFAKVMPDAHRVLMGS
jgi:hypothetical protein